MSRGRAPFLLLTVFAALLATTSALAATTPSIAAKQAQANQVIGEINGLNASLDRSDELMNLANLKLSQVEQGIAMNRRELMIAKHNLLESRRTVAQRLVNLYTSGSSSTLEVIMGAQSLGDVLDRIDVENRVSSLDSQVATQVVLFKISVEQHSRQLSVEQTQVHRLVAERTDEHQAIETRLGEERTLLASVNGQVQQLITAEQAREIAAGRAAAQQQASAAQSQQAQVFAQTPVGASVETPEGAAVVPPSSHGGVVGVALQYLGVPYVWAGASPSGFDCSGLVMYAYAQVGVSLPHSSYAMWSEGVPVPEDQLESGDIVFFDGLGHVGIYIGGGEFVHAPHTGTVVQVSSLEDGSYASSYDGARRIT